MEAAWGQLKKEFVSSLPFTTTEETFWRIYIYHELGAFLAFLRQQWKAPIYSVPSNVFEESKKEDLDYNPVAADPLDRAAYTDEAAGHLLELLGMDDTLRQLPFHYCDIPFTSKRRPEAKSGLADAYAKAHASATALDETIRDLIVRHFGGFYDPGNSLRELPYYTVALADDAGPAAPLRSTHGNDARDEDHSGSPSALVIAGGAIVDALPDQPHQSPERDSQDAIAGPGPIIEELAEIDGMYSMPKGTPGGASTEELDQ
ncbi:hypothetical protein FB107DRAFT_271811 [Schizophyllum commune]